MKNYILLIISSLLLFSCKKKNDDDALKNYAGEAIINVHKVFGKEALVSYVMYYPKAGAASKLQLKEKKGNEWQDVPFSDPNSIPIKGLKVATVYELRVVLSDAGKSAYSPVTEFTTEVFWIDMEAFFAVHPKIHDQDNGIAAYEGAHYEIKGEGFTNKADIQVVLESVENPEDRLIIPVTVKSDELMTFDLPADCISNAPYRQQKAYHMSIGNVLMVSYNSFQAGTFDYKANVLIQNRDIVIDSFFADPNTCKTMRIGGFFGPHEKEGILPAGLYGIPMKVLDRKLIFRQGGTKVKEVYVVTEGNVYCNGLAIAYADRNAIDAELLQFQETRVIRMQADMPPGSYTLQLEQLYADGTKGLSPEYNISF